MDSVYVVQVVKTLVIQANSLGDAHGKAMHYCDSDCKALRVVKVESDKDLPQGITPNDEPDNSIGQTIGDIVNF